MEEIVAWCRDNYRWLFGGIGGTLLFFLLERLFKRRKRGQGIVQTQRSGSRSTNVQIGEINRRDAKDD